MECMESLMRCGDTALRQRETPSSYRGQVGVVWPAALSSCQPVSLSACQLVSCSSCRTIELSHWANVSPGGQVYECYIYRCRRNPLCTRKVRRPLPIGAGTGGCVPRVNLPVLAARVG
jgi:hypothetical protein